ncbi:MAG: capsule assembly Wzi family protein, partial [Bryocella sp.]
AQNPFRLQEATLSFHLLGHEFSGGKSDVWQGPGLGGAMGWSNNAENIYSFRINRVEPLYIPLFSRIFGPLRYDFFVGSLQGHTAPNNPWVHSEQFSLRPTKNFEFAFQRTVIWGGKGHQPVTLHTFLRSFFSLVDTQGNPGSKLTADDPGARFSSFSFSYRLPWFARGVTLYTDMEAHDDVSPLSAPRRAAYRPGILFSHLPGMPRMEFRVEGMSTDSSTRTSDAGRFMYYEVIQRQGYTNKGQLFGDWVGREAKGGQAWLTYNMGPGEWVRGMFSTKQTAKDFISGGVHQNDYKIDVVKRLRPDVELNAWVQYERWKAPVLASVYGSPLQVIGGPLYFSNAKHNVSVAAQVTWYPRLKRSK